MERRGERRRKEKEKSEKQRRTDTCGADWDMIVVVNEYVGPLKKIATHKGASLPGFEEGIVLSETIDITVYHERYWNELVRQNMIRILYCMGIPKEMVVKEKKAIKWEMNYQRMKHTLYSYIKGRERTARSHWRNGLIWESKKYLLHILRALLVAHQLVEKGKIENYTQGNHFWPLAASTHFETYQLFFNWYKEHMRPLFEPLKRKLNCYKEVFEEMKEKRESRTIKNPLLFFDYLQFHCLDDLNQLDRELSYVATKITLSSRAKDKEEEDEKKEHSLPHSSSHLFLFERSTESPRHPEALLAYRVVAYRSRDHWKVLAMAPKKYFEHGSDRYVTDDYEKFVHTIDFKTARVYRKPQGFGVLMFWYEDDWKVVFPSSGFYAQEYLTRFSLTRESLSSHLSELFWREWDKRGSKKPGKEYRNWTFQFVFHPDLSLLQLDAIVDVLSLSDITMSDSKSKMGEEGEKGLALFERFSLLHLWEPLLRVPCSFPSPRAETEAAIILNFEAVQKMASGCIEMTTLKYEGFTLIDSSNARVQVSLPQYNMLIGADSRFERKNRAHNFLSIVRGTLNSKQGIGRILDAPNNPIASQSIIHPSQSIIDPSQSNSDSSQSIHAQNSNEDENGNDGEHLFCLLYPTWASWYRYILSVLKRVCEEVNEAYKPYAEIEDNEAFREAMFSLEHLSSKMFFKLRASKVSAFTYFTDLRNLNEGPATHLLKPWVSQRLSLFDSHPFDTS